MIILKNISWSNFLSTGNYTTTIDLLSAKTTLISGDNGSGKSTIMDAICYALFGKPFRKVNKPELINSITNKNLLVEIEFQTESGEYKIRRGMKPSLFEIYANGILIDQSADARDYQKVLEQTVLKIDYKTFIQKVIIGSANFTPFMQLSAAARRQVIEDLLDIQVFTQMNIQLKADAQENKELLLDNEQKTTLLEKTIDLYKNHNTQVLRDNDTVIQHKHEQLKKYAEENGLLSGRLEALQDKIERALACRGKRDDLTKEFTKTDRDLNRLYHEIETLEEFGNFIKDSDSCPTCKQNITADHKLTCLEDNVQKIMNIRSIANAVHEGAALIEKQLEPFEKLDEKIKVAETKAAEIISQINLNNRSITNLERDIEKLKNSDDQIKSYDKEEKELKALRKQKQALLEERELYNVALMLLKDGGIKANIIKQYIPIINKLVNKYLELMEFFCEFQVDENFNEVIKARYRDESSYESFSEGEKMRINLAILFTWREIARMRNSSSCNLLVLDEIMDSSLDAAGTDEFLKIIQQLASNNNIIIISHKSDQIADKFERIVRFNKTKNFSTVERNS